MNVIRILPVILCLGHSGTWAMNCADYNALGPDVASEKELESHPISKAQIEVVKENTALKAGRVAAMVGTPMARKLKKIMADRAQVAEMASGTSTLVRYDCYRNPDKEFYAAVSDQFEIVVEHISNKYN